MPWIEAGNEGFLNGVTAVELVAAPAAGRRLVRNVNFFNADTAAVTVTLRKLKGTTVIPLGRESLQPGDSWTPDRLIVLDATDESVQALLSAAPATANPAFDAAYADAT